MTWRLRSYDVSPPGGYFYDQPGPKPRSFQAMPTIEYQAKTVLDYRKRNGLDRATYAEALVDVDRFQCTRLGGNPAYCIPCQDDRPAELAMSPNAPGLVPCKGCAAKLE